MIKKMPLQNDSYSLHYCTVHVAVGGFLIVLNTEWTINDVFLTSAETKFVVLFFFTALIFPFK